MMKIELIPVIEIGYNNQGVTEPEKYPYWQYPNIWDTYNEQSYQRAGFKDKLKSYVGGSSIYKLTDISDNNLTKLTIDHTQELRDGKFEREQASAFFGGYVLRIDGHDAYFPQCCGDLSDINYWERLADGQTSYYNGHPGPYIKFEGTNVLLDFSVDEFDEQFQPTPVEQNLLVDRNELKCAVEKAKVELQFFEKRLNQIDKVENLNIDNIGGLLIWGDGHSE
ncbi:hypothetical protein GCM10028824_02490 [Hymenobacter segetis]|uniref:Uncharacterized protein n=1 Tax=Hymenobacter segetis TaxID=2025509 RepID=A0ABU9LQL8_9BACT